MGAGKARNLKERWSIRASAKFRSPRTAAMVPLSGALQSWFAGSRQMTQPAGCRWCDLTRSDRPDRVDLEVA